MSVDLILDEILNLKEINPNYELETIIKKEITSEQFKNLAKFLSKTDYERIDEPEVLDINFYTNNKKDNLSIRYTITGLDDIRNYCRTERATNFIKLYKSKIEWPKETIAKLESSDAKFNRNAVFVDDYDYNYRINLKSEIKPNDNGRFIDKIAQDEDNELNNLVQRIGYENILKTFRFKKRTTFITSDKKFRIDMSIVKSSKKTNTPLGRMELLKTKTFKESNCLNEKEVYEVEVEYIGNNIDSTNKKVIKNELISITLLALANLFSKTNTIISNRVSSDVLNEYMATIKQMIIKSAEKQIEEVEQDIKNPYSLNNTVLGKTKEDIISSLKKTKDMAEKGRGWFKNKPSKYFYGPKPVSMNIENIQKNYPINILNGFSVTDKADGETCILFINNNGGIFLIDTNMNIYNVSHDTTKSKTNLFSTILIGEYISGDIPCFYCFDCYLVNSNDTRLLPLVSSDDINSRIKMANEVINKLNELSNLPVKLAVKKFLWNQSVFSLAKTIWDAKDSYPYRLDGIIYTPIDYPVGFEPNKIDWLLRIGSTWNYNLKWKPPQENTIDFLIKVEKERIDVDVEKGIFIERDKIKYRTELNGEKVEFQPYKTINLYCGFMVNVSGKACSGIIDGDVKTSTLGEEANKYKATPFTPTNPYNEKAYIAYIACDDEKNNNIFGIHDHQKILDNTIVEFAYDLTADANTDEERAFRWKPLRTRIEKTDAYYRAIREKVRLYNIYEKYRDLNVPKGYQWSKYERDELEQLNLLIRTYDLKEVGNKRDWSNYIYSTITARENKKRLQNIIESYLDMPVEINYGNNFRTANAIWRSIYFPITDEMITTGEGIPTENEADVLYYNRTDTLIGRDKSLTYPLQDFHNKYIKNHSLYEIVVQSLRLNRNDDIDIHLLDLACGKAGDLYKWNEKKIGNVVGVDLNQNNIENINDGACVRYMEFKKRMESFGQKDIPNVNFLVGDISLNIADGTAMRTSDSRNIQKKLWDDIYNTRGFDIISIQFALHYLFENEGKLDGLLKNISQNLRPGGFLIGTCFDGATIYNALKNKKMGQSISGSKDEKVIWKIKKMYENMGETIPIDSTSLGMSIEVYVQSINQSIREYLVSFEYLVNKLDEYHLELVNTNLFEDIYNKFRGELKHDLSVDEKRLSFMNRLFIFKKKSAEGISLYEAYQQIISLKSNPKFNLALSHALNQKKWGELQKLLDISGIIIDDFEELKKKLQKDWKEGVFKLEPLRKPKSVTALKEVIVEPSKEVIVEPSKKVVVEPSKEVIVEPSKEVVVEPSKEVIAEPSKEVIVEPSKEVVAEPSKEVIVEPSKEVVLEPSKEVVVKIKKTPKKTEVSKESIKEQPAVQLVDNSKKKWVDDFHTLSKNFGSLKTSSFDKKWLERWIKAINKEIDKYKSEFNENDKLNTYMSIINMINERIKNKK